jgi:hypothetical protein
VAEAGGVFSSSSSSGGRADFCDIQVLQQLLTLLRLWFAAEVAGCMNQLAAAALQTEECSRSTGCRTGPSHK